MTKLAFTLVFVFVGAPSFALGLFFVMAASLVPSGDVPPRFTVAPAEAPAVSARSYYVFDLETGTPIAMKDEDTLRPIASVTKLISSTVFFTGAELGQEVTITAADVATEGVSGRLTAGDTYLARELLFPALLESSNDAAEAEMRIYPGDMLLEMHALANRAGANDASFNDASGLSAGNVASARSLAKLLTLIAREEPHLFDITRLTKYVHTNTTWLNNNPLASLPGYRGGKHGFTHEAGRTAVAVFIDVTSTGEPRQVGYVLLNTDDLLEDVKVLRAFTTEYTRME